MNGGSRPIELILFDAVGTLIEPAPPVAQAYFEVANQFHCGSALTTEMISYRFKDAWKRSVREQLAVERAGRTSEELELERWLKIVREVFAESDDIFADLIFSRLWQHFGEPWHWKVFPDVAPTIAELHRRGYRVGIASNFDQRLLNVCRGHECLADLDPIFISSQVGWSKPAAGFYRQIEILTGLAPQSILLVGDDYENDVGAPRALGWQARWLVRQPVPQCHSAWHELTELLRELP